MRLMLVLASVFPLVSAALPPRALPVVSLGLSGPLEELRDLEEFTARLSDRLVWSLEDDQPTTRRPLRLAAVRVDRGRVTASCRSKRAGVLSARRERVAETIGADEFLRIVADCFSTEDPPARVRAVGGTTSLGVLEIERAVAGLARDGRVGAEQGVGGQIPLEWGRHVVLFFWATTDPPNGPVRTLPLILVFERI